MQIVLFLCWILLGMAVVVLLDIFIKHRWPKRDWKIYYNPVLDMPEGVFFRILSLIDGRPLVAKAVTVFKHQMGEVYARITIHDRATEDFIRSRVLGGNEVEIYREGQDIHVHHYNKSCPGSSTTPKGDHNIARLKLVAKENGG